MVFYPQISAPRLRFPSDLHNSELPSPRRPPPSPPSGCIADGRVREVAAEAPKDVCGGSMKEVSYNAMVTMANFIGSLGLKKQFDSSLVRS